MNEDIAKHLLQTGTVTIGVVCKDGIVLGADRRVSFGGNSGVVYFADKMRKLMMVTPNIVTSMAGVVSDAKKTIAVLQAEIRLKELRTREKAIVSEVASLLANMNYNSIRTPSMIPAIAHLILAGKDIDGLHLYDITPDGHIKEATRYVSSGSGIMQVDPILDSEYRDGMSMQEGIALIRKCIMAASGREPSVGAGMDICTITKDGVKQVVEQEVTLDFREVKSK